MKTKFVMEIFRYIMTSWDDSHQLRNSISNFVFISLQLWNVSWYCKDRMRSSEWSNTSHHDAEFWSRHSTSLMVELQSTWYHIFPRVSLIFLKILEDAKNVPLWRSSSHSQGHGKCLEDWPEPFEEYQYPELPAGAMYNADLQCRLQFNSTDETIKVCSQLDEICSQLWCSIDDTCTTLLRPAAPGTHCSRHKVSSVFELKIENLIKIFYP